MLNIFPSALMYREYLHQKVQSLEPPKKEQAKNQNATTGPKKNIMEVIKCNEATVEQAEEITLLQKTLDRRA